MVHSAPARDIAAHAHHDHHHDHDSHHEPSGPTLSLIQSPAFLRLGWALLLLLPLWVAVYWVSMS